MHAIILGAGMGSRLLPLTTFTPKPLLKLADGSTILLKQLSALALSKLASSATLVAGYKIESVESWLAETELPLPTNIVFNPGFDLTGPLLSLWMARDSMRDDDFIILNGDTVVSSGAFTILGEVVSGREGNYLAVSKPDGYNADDMLVSLAQDSTIQAVDKQLAREHTDAISAGVLAVTGTDNRDFLIKKLTELLKTSKEARREWPWHSLLNFLISEGKKIQAVMIPAATWREVDTVPDLSEASSLQDGS